MNYLVRLLGIGLFLTLSAGSVEAIDTVPLATSHYTQDAPASASPFLTWNNNLNAVYYQIEFFNRVPRNLSILEPSDSHSFFSDQVYTNAYNPKLTDFAARSIGRRPIYWRVRAMAIDHTPITSFSELELLYTDENIISLEAPVPNIEYNKGNGTILLYPVYSWVKNYGAENFEVEILDEPPENPNGTSPSEHRIDTLETRGGEIYDTLPRMSSRPFYWRVRGFAEDGVTPVGHYSDTQTFLTDPQAGWKVAIYGDSISHGGGHISFGPADWEYSYAFYLHFPTVNLSRSGDTSSSMVDRFDDDVLPFYPHYLLIMGGSNSLRGGVPADEVINDLKTLQMKCLKNGITPIFLTLPPINPENIKRAFDQDTVEDWQLQFAAVNAFIRENFLYIDIAAAMEEPEGILLTSYGMDGLHPDVEGKKIMANTINTAWPKRKNRQVVPEDYFLKSWILFVQIKKILWPFLPL